MLHSICQRHDNPAPRSFTAYGKGTKKLPTKHVLNPHASPSGNFALSNWTLTLPVGPNGQDSGIAFEIKNLAGYQNIRYFFTGTDGAMVFDAPVKGATTSGSIYTRSELREMNGTARAAWTVKQGGTLRAELAVSQVGTAANGMPGSVVIGQVHGQAHELCRLYYTPGAMYFIDDQAGPGSKPMRFDLKDTAGHTAKISLNQKFDYTIDVHNGKMTVDILVGGHDYTAVEQIAAAWTNDQLYFKAGVYNAVGTAGSGARVIGTGDARASFYSLAVTHS